MTDALLVSLTRQRRLIRSRVAAHFLAHPDLFPTYQSLDHVVLDIRIEKAVDDMITLVADGDLSGLRDRITGAFSNRLRAGFNPNELIRTVDVIAGEVSVAINALLQVNETERQRAVDRVLKGQAMCRLHVTTLNLSIPRDERYMLDPDLLKPVR